MPTTESLNLPGLEAPARITVDRWGIAHVEAASRRDAFFLQGFNAARDRLWQIDLWRKRGLGLMAADFGPGYLEQDKAARLFLYRGDMAAEWAAYGPGGQAACEAFAEGINAYVGLTEREPARLPPEFALMGTRPQRWAAEDVVRIRSHGLTRNALSEVVRQHVLAKGGGGVDFLRKPLEPAHVVVEPVGQDWLVPLEALDLFRLASAPPTFPPERLAATLEEAAGWRKVTELGEVLRDLDWTGSNNWAVAGARTSSGKPILASDPHRAHAYPSLRYIVHLSAPGLSLIGAGEPAVPGVSLGHNGQAAFGLTIFGADQEDVYVYETHPDDPDRYRHGDGWEPMRIRRERIAVKGYPDQEVALAFTRHGPVLHRDPAARRAVAVRSVWFEPGAAPYLVSLRMMEATTPETFRDGARHWGAPSVNLVYADVSGHIGWIPAGLSPVRSNWDGLLPVPGDGSHEWEGFLRAGTGDAGELPSIVDPPCGFVFSANEMNLPEGWDHARSPVGFEWIDAARATRIREVLAATGAHDVAASRALQTDAVSIPARRIARLLAPLEALDGDAALGLELLREWDHDGTAESAAGALFEVWWTRHLKPAVIAALAPDPVLRALLAPGDTAGILAALEATDGRWGAEPAAMRDALLLATLAEAVAETRGLLGDHPDGWAWGHLHHGFFAHPLSLSGKAEAAGWSVGPVPKGGSAPSVMHAGYRPEDFRVTHGASFRMVVDLSDLDASRCMNAPGQSGDPRSPHAGDLTPLWAQGDYVPMLWSKDAVAEAAEHVITLAPG